MAMKRWAKGSVPHLVHWVLASVMLVGSGVLYRHLEPQFRGTGTAVIKLPVPLSDFPDRLAEWKSFDLTIPTTTDSYMRRNFADDYFSRRFTNKRRNTYADMYVVYCASRPAGIKGHRPGVCYPAHGWILDQREQSEFTTVSGRRVPCLIHRMRKPLPGYAEAVVLSFYVASGKIVTNEKAFSGLMGRKLNTAGNPAVYVSQVQISASTESAVRALAVDAVDTVLEFLPNASAASSSVEQ